MPDWTGAGAGSLFSTINPFPLGANVTYESVRNADLSTLKSTVTSLGNLTAKLGELEQDAAAMNRMAQGSLWAGINATVSKAHVGRTAGKFTHAHTQAESLHTILNTLLADLQASQGTLLQLEQNSEADGIRISPDGTISSSEPPHLTFQQASINNLFLAEEQVPPETLQAMQDASGRINQAIEEAAESDRIAARALAEIMEESNGKFTATDLNSLEDARTSQSAQDAEAVVALADKEEKTAGDWRMMGDYFALHADDPEFATYVIDTIGMESYLALVQEMEHSTTELASANVDIDDIKAGMANTLNTAMSPSVDITTHPPGSETYQSWLRTEEGRAYERRLNALNEIGAERIYNPPSWVDAVQDARIGYDVFLDLMENAGAPLNNVFYHDVLSGMIAAEKTHPHLFNREPYPPLDGEWNPDNDVTDRMLGIGSRHNPDAVTYFFDPEVQDTEGMDNLDYFIGTGSGTRNDRAMMHEVSEFRMLSPDYHDQPGLAAALETASTGIPPGHIPGEDYPGQTATNTRIAEEVWNTFGNDPSRLVEGGRYSSMNAALGHIAADYLPDIYQSLHGTDIAPGRDPRAGFDSVVTEGLLRQLGKDSEAYSSITAANQAHMAVAVDKVVATEGISQEMRRTMLEDVSYPTGMVSGIMTDARASAMYQEQLAADASHNEIVNGLHTWTDRALNVAIYEIFSEQSGFASLADAIKGDFTDQIFGIAEADNSATAEEYASHDYATSRSASMDNASAAVKSAVERYSLDLTDEEIAFLTNGATGATEEGYRAGATGKYEPSES
ncbi:hypothetical protein [Streptomyces sp. NRRL F-2890]|uniref:hypothetical protein n=1 Tax=Streptomyces sp. NRRL F-2890 TaxID=1463845 RepID=UPI0004CA5D38|nr:hypothetical protein [Streptomyces sp. NRRL F-2890]